MEITSVSKRLRCDALLIAAVIILAAAALLAFSAGKRQGVFAVVYVSGKEAARLELSQDAEMTFTSDDGGHNCVVVRGGAVSVTEADCPDLICKRHAPISQVGESIICLPHRLVVTIEGGADE